MNDNGRKLRELKNAFPDFIREHEDALSKNPTIRRPLEEAAAEARRRDAVVNEGNSHPLGLNE